VYLINHVHHEVWHDIEERWWEAHLELAKSLHDELFQGRQLSFIDDLLGDATNEVAHPCDHLWTDGPDHNRKKHRQHDVAVV
jgi:hypothetical protein